MRTVLIENGFGPLSRENILRVFILTPHIWFTFSSINTGRTYIPTAHIGRTEHNSFACLIRQHHD